MNLMQQIVQKLSLEARTGVNDDDPQALEYIQRCTLDVGVADGKGVRFVYTRSIHEGKYFLYLSLAFRKAPYTAPADFDHRFAKRAIQEFWGGRILDAMAYPPAMEEAKKWKVWHYRLFTTDEWMPSGYRPLHIEGGPLVFTWAQYSAASFIH